MKCSIFFISVFVIALAISHSVNENLSFSGPFDTFNYDGSRLINNWFIEGDAVINENFVRLTPDRQSKSGQIWSRTTFNNGEWVTIIKFRISGQGSTLYGDGFSVFFTQSDYPRNGKMYGVKDNYYGFAIAFSTFKNTEFSRYHRDIAVYLGYNDGQGAFTQEKDHTGCYSNYRFHEKRQDFSVDNYAVVKIGYSAITGKITVSVDEKNTGAFHTCFTEQTSFKADWWKTAYLGISASTGQLADNHDILSVETIVGESDPDKVTLSQSKELKALEDAENSLFQEMMKKYGVNVEALDAREKLFLKMIENDDKNQQLALKKIKRELEHKIVAVDDSLNNMIKKLNERGDISEGRITELEESLKKDVTSSVVNQMEKRVKVLEDGFNKNLQAAVKKSSAAWMIPFVLVVVVIAIIVLVVYSRYRTAQKTHLL